MNREPEIINKIRLLMDGFVYVRSYQDGNKTYWDCYKLRKHECSARAITVHTSGGNFIVTKGVNESKHDHPPNREYAEAEKIKLNLKKKAEAHPEEPPSRLLRNELAGVSSGVVSQLPERESLKKSMRYVRRKNLPKNPVSLQDLGDLPSTYKKTATGDNFMIYDSREDDDSDDDDDENDDEERIIVFATRRNIELLSSSPIWFLDGTFKVLDLSFYHIYFLKPLTISLFSY